MSHTENNRNIEKFDGSFEKEESGCTILVNQTINSIKNFAALGFYSYLMCRPTNWRVNVKHIAKEKECTTDSIYKLINKLIELRLLTRTAVREKGRFVRHHYKLYLRPIDEPIVQPPPLPENAELVNPLLEDHDAYKTKRSVNKENKISLSRSEEILFTSSKEKKKALAFKALCLESQECQALYEQLPSDVKVDKSIQQIYESCSSHFGSFASPVYATEERFQAWLIRELAYVTKPKEAKSKKSALSQAIENFERTQPRTFGINGELVKPSF